MKKNEFKKVKKFKKVKRLYIESCETIIKNKGRCEHISCRDCPFSSLNSVNNKDCVNNNYAKEHTPESEKDHLLLKSAKKYLKLYKKEV